MKLEILKDNLSSGGNDVIHILKASCRMFDASLFYYGDYAADRSDDGLSFANFTSVIKLKKRTHFIMDVRPDGIYLEPDGPSVRLDSSKKILKELEELIESAEALDALIRERFPGMSSRN